MKALARSYFYWPKIDLEIEHAVSQCPNCMNAAEAPVKANLGSWKRPKRPRERVHIDDAGPSKGHYFLVVVDAYSKWPEFFSTDTITTDKTISLLRRSFSRFGMPETLVAVNGTQFSSAKVNDFCSSNGTELLHSSPYHPSSNGQAERFVDTLKRGSMKLKGEGTTAEALQMLQLAYGSTPNPTLAFRSPAELMLGRRLRTALELVKPAEHSDRRNRTVQEQYNRHHVQSPRSSNPAIQFTFKIIVAKS